MKINKDEHMVYDESGAYKTLLNIIVSKCHNKFLDKMEDKDGWDYDDDEDLLNHFRKQISCIALRIKEGGFTENDIINLINYSAMLYNIMPDTVVKGIEE